MGNRAKASPITPIAGQLIERIGNVCQLAPFDVSKFTDAFVRIERVRHRNGWLREKNVRPKRGAPHAFDKFELDDAEPARQVNRQASLLANLPPRRIDDPLASLDATRRQTICRGRIKILDVQQHALIRSRNRQHNFGRTISKRHTRLIFRHVERA